jgi:multidrug resistance efflux pump
LILALTTAGVPIATAGKDKKAEQPAPKMETLEQIQAEALRNSADIKIAEIKVRLAEAELEGARLALKAKVAAAHADVEAAAAAEKEAHVRYGRAKGLYEKLAISAEELGSAQLTWLKLKSEHTSAKEVLKLHVGSPSAGKTELKKANTDKKP